MLRTLIAAAISLGLAASAALAQEAKPELPGAADLARVEAGTYQVDADHTQVIWTVNHMGLSPLTGMFGRMSGTLNLDPKAPEAAKVEIAIPMAGLTVTSEAFAKHLASPEFFDTAKFPSGRFTSTKIAVSGSSARIDGDLTVHGVTRPVTLDATFFGAGIDVVSKLETIGFTATATVKRSDFGLGFAAPLVSDDVSLEITGVFHKKP